MVSGFTSEEICDTMAATNAATARAADASLSQINDEYVT
jgi:hypothetical protein